MQKSGCTARSHVGRLAMTAFAALLVLSGTAGAASAHTGLDSSTPGDGATVQSLEVVTLRFAGRVAGGPDSVVMTTEDGRPVQLSAPQVTDDTLTAEISGSPPEPGRYSVSYRVKSADGDPVAGSLTFTVAGSAESEPARASEPAPTTATPVAPTETPTATEGAATDTEGSRGTLLLGLGVAVAVAAGIGLALFRRRSRP